MSFLKKVAGSSLFVNALTAFPSVFKGYRLGREDESHCKRVFETFSPIFAPVFYTPQAAQW